MYAFSASPVVEGNDDEYVYAFAASPIVGERVNVCVYVRGFPNGGGEDGMCVYSLMTSPVARGEDARVSRCMHSWLLPVVGGRGRTCVYAFTAYPVVGGENGCEYAFMPSSVAGKDLWVYLDAFVASPCGGGEDAYVCMHSRLLPLVGKRADVCLYACGSPRGGGRGRIYVYVGAFVEPPVVRGKYALVCMRSWRPPWLGEMKNVCMRPPLAPWWGKRTNVCVYVTAALPVVGGEDTSACTRSRLAP